MIVYWGVPAGYDELFLGLHQPEPAFTDLKALRPDTSIGNRQADFTQCPAVIDYSKNLYSLKSPLKIEFWWENNDVMFENLFSEDFFRKIVDVRDRYGGLVSLNIIPYIFFAEDSCTMQYSGSGISNNTFAENCAVIPGQVDVGQWFRPTDLAFVIKNKNEKIIINKDDVLANIRFCTKEKITFQKFYYTDQIDQYVKKIISYKLSQNNKLKNYFAKMYHDFERSKLRELILNEIKKNLMD